jgi:hypothetical protein
MTILQRAIWMAAKRAAADSRVQAKAAEVVRDEIVPRARAALDVARPEVRRAKENIRRAGQEIKKAVSDRPEIQGARDFLSGTKRPPK